MDPWDPWFRGHKSADWELKPKLYRTCLSSAEDYKKIEDEIREEFIKRAPIMCEALPAGEETRAEWEWYFMMQHHHAATRLLDWTDGALIALYFAVKENCGESDAAVWVLNPYELNSRATAKWPIRLSPVEREWVMPPSAIGLDPRIQRQLARWLPRRFQKKAPRLPRQVLAVEPTHSVRRMSSQHSCFTIHGRDPEALDKLEAGSKQCLVKVTIPTTAIAGVEKELRRCGIDESTIFPDLDGLGRSINARWKLDKAWPEYQAPHEGVYARIRPSKTHGVGVFAIRPIRRGTQLFQEDDSELIWKQRRELKLDKLPREIRRLYDQFCLIKDKGETYGCPKSFNLMTIAWYLNHSSKPNVRCDEDYSFFALRDIKVGEELTADYHTYNEFASAIWV